MKRLILITALLFVATGIGLAQDSSLLLQRPTLSKTHIAFNFAGDIWIVAREGGEAKQLTTGTGIETSPIFSPDGATVAFSGQYDGNTDIFTDRINLIAIDGL